MGDTLSRNWWAVAVRGLLAIGFGLLTWARPGVTMVVFVLLFGIYALDDGIFAVVAAVRAAKKDEVWWPLALEGLVGLTVGIFAFVMPASALVIMLFIIGVWAVTTGTLGFVTAIRLRKQIRGEWLLALSAILRVAFGVLLFLRPGTGVAALIWLTGAYAFAFGLVLLGLSFRLRQHRKEVQPTPPETGGVTPQPV